MFVSQVRRTTNKIGQIVMAGRSLPIHPTDLVVLAICVVVAGLRPPALVAGHDHRRPLREQQRGQEIADLPLPPGDNRRDVGRTFDAVVVRSIV